MIKSILVLLLLVLALAGLPFLRISIPLQANAVSLTLWGSISQGGWGTTSSSITSPGPTLTVASGASVTMNLFAADSTHTFCVDYNADHACNTPTEPLSPAFSSSSAPTSYTFTATATPGTYTYFCTIHGYTAMNGPFVVTAPPPNPDFSISPSPTGLIIDQGVSAISTLTLTSLNSFSGTVNLSTTVSPIGITPVLNQTSIDLSSNGSHPATLNVTVPKSATPGAYTVTVTGSSGSLSHSATVTVSVAKPDFTIVPGIAQITVRPGASSSATITLKSLGGFNGTVSLTTSIAVTGITDILSPTSVPLSSGGTGSSTLTISATNSTAIGSYDLQLNGTSGSISHFTTITLNVSNLSSSPEIPISTLLLIGGVVILAAVIVVAVLVIRAGRRTRL